MRSRSVSSAVYQPWRAHAARASAAGSPGVLSRRTGAPSRSRFRLDMAVLSSASSPRSLATAAADAACSGLIEPQALGKDPALERLGQLLEPEQIDALAGVGPEALDPVRPEATVVGCSGTANDDVNVRARPEP